MASLALAAALTLGPAPFFHTDVELADWQEGWSQRMVEGETPKLIAEFLDMSDRHPCRVLSCPLISPYAASVSGATGTPSTHPPSPGVEQWRPLVAHYWPAEHVDLMLRIMDCESGGDPYADNPTSSATGLFQIMGFWQEAWPGDYTDPWTNAAVAYQIWLSQGYGAWRASKGCWS